MKEREEDDKKGEDKEVKISEKSDDQRERGVNESVNECRRNVKGLIYCLILRVISWSLFTSSKLFFSVHILVACKFCLCPSYSFFLSFIHFSYICFRPSLRCLFVL